MTTTIDDTADQLLNLSHRIERLESGMAYSAGLIASMAADGETTTPVFESTVSYYRQLRTEHAEAKAAHAALLG